MTWAHCWRMMMPESDQHSRLVQDLSRFITLNYLAGDSGLVLHDSLGVSVNDRCHEINGYIPDVIAHPLNGPYKCIIGEAKTYRDIETKHSSRQLESYLQYCAVVEHSALLIVAVPWAYYPTARQLLTNIAKRNNFNRNTFIVPTEFRA